MLLEVADPNAYNATLYDKLSFNFAHDITPVASIDRAPFVMVVNPSLPAKTVTEFIAYAEANAGKINMGSSRIGASSGLFGELFKTMTGIEMAAVQHPRRLLQWPHSCPSGEDDHRYSDARAQSSPPSDNPELENPTERRRVDL